MGKSYSGDLRDRVNADIEAGHSRRAAGRRFGVSASFSVKLAQRVAKTGSTAPARQGRPVGGGKLAPHKDQLIAWVEAEPDITMPELATKLVATTGGHAHLRLALTVAAASRLPSTKTLLASEAERADGEGGASGSG